MTTSGKISLMNPFQRFFKEKMNSGILLVFVSLVAFCIANSPLKEFYQDLWKIPVRLQFGDFNVFSHGDQPMNFGEFINDVLMAIFFFSVGLEIKREVVAGELHNFRQALLPIVAACGGMLFPVLVFMLTSGSGDASRGAAIPMATDIAFSIGVLSLLGSRVPLSLKIFLTAFAVTDDIGGIIVIALFYSQHLNLVALIPAVLVLALLYFGGRRGINSKLFYMLFGGVVWYFFLRSGIHATIAGVLVALTIPATPGINVGKYIASIRKNVDRFPKENEENEMILSRNQISILKKIESASDKVISPLQDLEDDLFSIVNYMIMPLFAFANAGITIDHISLGLFGGVTMSVASGLVFGKCIGIFLFSFLLIKFGVSKMPTGMTWKNLFGVSLIGGVGFTVSLFIATLSFSGLPGGEELLNQARLGVLSGSAISGVLGYFVLNRILPESKEC